MYRVSSHCAVWCASNKATTVHAAGQSDTMEPSHDRHHLWAHRSRKPSPDRRGILSPSLSLPAPDRPELSRSMSALSPPVTDFGRVVHWRDRLTTASCAARTNAIGSSTPPVSKRFPRPGELARNRARDDSGIYHVGGDVCRPNGDRLGVASSGSSADSDGDVRSCGNDTPRITRAASTGGVVVVIGRVSNIDGSTDSGNSIITHAGLSKSAENVANASDQARQPLRRRNRLLDVNHSWPSTW